MSGTLALNTQANNNVTPRDTKGLPKKPCALVTTFVTALTIPLNPPKNDLIPVSFIGLADPPILLRNDSSFLFI